MEEQLARIVEVVDRATERQTARVYETGFTVGSLARVGTRDGTWGLGIKVGSDKELTKVARMVGGGE